MLDLVKKVLASHKCQMDRSREQYARDLAGTLASAVPTGAWVCRGRHGVGDTGTTPARPPPESRDSPSTPHFVCEVAPSQEVPVGVCEAGWFCNQATCLQTLA